MKIKITYTNSLPWNSNAPTLTATSEGENKDKALNNFYLSPKGKRAKTVLKTETV